ncbi:hypothetical protein QZH41_003137 [Actinostola sp. cb2023]|nr:hypothetical protein QZH41_003757 [Actinostola sp. cb2023]KAK3735650.1 hypothetical protein QZH41_009737 [Actinostola sp. cb2023]KAK3736562.1 hypothetical protein QZH41_003137 [Actinostola sp. cb2023]
MSANMADRKEMEYEVYSVETLKMITDAQFEAMGMAIGETAMLRAMISQRNKDQQDNCPMQDDRKEEIRRAIEKIKNERKLVKKQKSDPASTKAQCSKAESKAKEKKIKIGWLHRTQGAKYKQVRRTGGGSIRRIVYTDDNDITVEFLKSEGQRMFFPGGVSVHGPLKNMKVALGNFEQEAVSKFTDTEGNECSYPEYLRSRGLYASRSYIYLMTTAIPQQDDKERDEEEKATSQCEPTTKLPNLVYAVCSAEDDGIDVKSNVLCISYEETKESSYSEVIMRSVSTSRYQCYDLQCLDDPLAQDTELDNYDPLENNFKVTEITKGNTCYLKKDFVNTTESDVSEESFSFPQLPLDSWSNKIILHPPSEVWGYDDNKLLLCVVTSCHEDAYYTWYLDG